VAAELDGELGALDEGVEEDVAPADDDESLDDGAVALDEGEDPGAVLAAGGGVPDVFFGSSLPQAASATATAAASSRDFFIFLSMSVGLNGMPWLRARGL
jgi:hypothetical protein